MTTSINNFYELHVNLCMHMNCLEDYLKTIGTRQDRKYFVVTLDGNCWIIDPIKFNESFDEQNCTADGKIKTLNNIPENTTKIKIPNSVTNIENDTFAYCCKLTDVTIPDSVTSIGERAFYGCSGLTSVTIGNSVRNIWSSAFYGCSRLASVTIPASVTSIGASAFYGCSRLTSVIIGNSVTSIGHTAFSGCTDLANVTIPDSVTSIGEYAFDSCSGLMAITISESNPAYKSVDGLLLSKDGTTLIQGVNSDVTIPNSVTSIGEDAFFNCTSLTDVTIPDSVTSIGSYAFGYCTNLTSVTIPDSVTIIGYEAFYRCTSLKSLVFKGKTLDEVKKMNNYPWRIEDKSIIKAA